MVRGAVARRQQYRVGLPSLPQAARIIQQVWRQYAPVRESRKRERQQYERKIKDYTSSQRTSKRKRIAPKRFYTVGIHGPRFRKTKKYYPGKYLRHGSTRYVETGGTVSSADCPYVGHTFGMSQLYRTCCDVVILKLWQKAGKRVTTMEDTGIFSGSLLWAYRSNVGTPIATRTVAFTSANTLHEISEALASDIAAFVSANSTMDDFTMVDIRLSELVGVDSSVKAFMFFEDMLLDIDCSSALALQNRTLSDSTSADPSNRNEVTNNPIGGKSYEGFGTGSSLKLWNNSVTIPGTMLVGNVSSGAISFDINSANVSSGQKNVYKRPQPASSFRGVKKCAPAFLSPGQIRNSRLVFKKKMSWNFMIKKMWLLLKENLATTQFMTLGYFRFFAFEKKCNTQVAGEASIDIGYELNNVYRVKLSTAYKACAPHVSVV